MSPVRLGPMASEVKVTSPGNGGRWRSPLQNSKQSTDGLLHIAVIVICMYSHLNTVIFLVLNISNSAKRRKGANKSLVTQAKTHSCQSNMGHDVKELFPIIAINCENNVR